MLILVGVFVPVYGQEFSFTEQLTTNEDYLQLKEKVVELENHKTNNIVIFVQTIAGIATAGAFAFLGYQTLMLRSEKNHTLRALVGETSTDLDIFSYINDQGEEKSHDEMKVMTNQARSQFNWTSLVRVIMIKNYGTITANNVKMRTKLVVGKKPDKKEILSLKYGTDGMSLLPNGSKAMTFRWTKKQEDAIVDPKTLTYFLTEIFYNSANSNKERKKGMLLQIHPTHNTVLENWDESIKF